VTDFGLPHDISQRGDPPRLAKTKPKPTGRKLTAYERRKLPKSQFALPAQRRYPIPDRYHAQLALRDMAHESLTTQTHIRQAIRKKFPGLI
jgi:hypothetical protein